MTRIVPDRLTPEMHDALLDKVSSADGLHPDAGYEAAIAASPGQGAVTAAQLEAAAEAHYLVEPWRHNDEPIPWYGIWDTARKRRINQMRAALAALGLAFASEPTRSEGEG